MGEELLRQHPDLRPAHVYSALTYFYDHRDAMVTRMKESFSALEAHPAAQPFSRDELLRRKIAEAMTRSKFTATHFTVVEELDVTDLVALGVED